MKHMTRRELLIKGTALFATLGLGVPLFLNQQGHALITDAALADQADSTGAASGTGLAVKSPVLVVVQLSGGNDGMNTVIPYGLGGYFDARPTLKVTEDEVLALNGQIGLHPSLVGLHEMYKNGKLAVIQGVGYPNPDRSHFRSMDIWETAVPEKLSHSGWLGRYVQSSLGTVRNPLKAVQVGNNASKVFNGDQVNVPVIQTMETFNFLDPKTPVADQNRIAKAFLDMYDPERQGEQLKVTCQRGIDAYNSVEAIHSLSPDYQNKVEYPKGNFAKDLQLVAKMLAGKSGTRVFYVQLGGFDDHAQEKEQHASLLKELDLGLQAFYQDLEAQDLESEVVTMAFSEFGRRVKENGSGGTDHGTAAPVFVLGGNVKGGLYGVYPSLTDLDRNGDLKYEVDFRSVYYTLMDGWLKGDAVGVLGKSYEKLQFI